MSDDMTYIFEVKSMFRKFRWPVLGLLGLAGTLVAVACTSQASSTGDDADSDDRGQWEATSPAPTLERLQQLGDLRNRFNAQAGNVRLVLLLSPT
jgi:hypothetical protein